MESNKKNINNLTVDDIFRLMDLYFNRKNYVYRHLYDSYNKFIEEDITTFLSGDHIFTEILPETGNKFYRYKFRYENIRVKTPVLGNGDPLYPSDARQFNLTYSIKIVADVFQYQDVINIATDEIVTKLIGTVSDVIIAIVPLMLRSKWCSLTLNPDIEKNECEYDPGGYFIVNGNEKVVICQDKMVKNKTLVLIKKDSGNINFVAKTNSESYKPRSILQSIEVKLKKDGIITIRVPLFKEINIMILLKALGLKSDKEIIDYIVFNEDDIDMIALIRNSLINCVDHKGNPIQNQEEAIDYLTTELRVLKKYTETDETIIKEQKRIHLLHLLQDNFLPHVEGSLLKKAIHICYMINKLLLVELKRVIPDDRDSYVNKRVDNVGDLLFELFKQFYKKLLGECKKYFDNRSKDHEHPILVINMIKPTTIEQGIKAGLSTGNWTRRTGVAQPLQRYTFLQSISFLRRVDAQTGESSSVKLMSPRHLHPSSVGLLCLTGDTEILMKDGRTKLIKNINDNDSVITFSNKLKKKASKIKNYFGKMSTKLLKITTINGRHIKCTPDHLFLIGDEFRKAGDLKAGDLMMIYYLGNYYGSTSQEIEYCKYKFHNSDKRDDELLTSKEFTEIYYVKKNFMAIPIEKIEEIPNEMVYDFETTNSNHTFLANEIITHNCSVATPEHAKIGMTKHLSMVGSITIMSRDLYALIREFVIGRVQEIDKIPYYKLINSNLFKVFLNSEWMGMVEDAVTLENEFNDKRLNGDIDSANTSIVLDIQKKELHVYCDSGRLYRPVIRVVDNVVQLTREQINSISLNKTDEDKVTTWDDFLLKYKGVIDYIDMETQPFILIADDMKKIEFERKKMVKSINKVKDIKSDWVDNRYDDMFFIKYTHCEFHPSLLLGEVSCNSPLLNHNQGPRNIFNYAQGRQAMGIYATNYRERLDISFILYHTQRPLVFTRPMKYLNTDILPAGENSIVAIACYTGFNQEDSALFNLTSIQRGKFRAMCLKKYISTIQKNQSTTQDDIFTKPDPNKVTGIKQGCYDKLNLQGHVPEETVVENGDVLIGKISPLQTKELNSEKEFRDSSEIYKMHVAGVVDRVYTGGLNPEGHEVKKILVRSERQPNIGDKFTSRSAQKATIGILLNGVDMPFTKDGIRPDIIINPNAMPGRMTIAQLLECLIGKVGAIKGEIVDGTPFEHYDFDSVKKELKSLGFDEDGSEYLYNGMTGEKIKTRIFIGPTYYQRLKHIASDKIHSRARGAKQKLTMQAPEGRSREGGFRLGEMETQAICAHGMSKFLKEKLLDNSDIYATYVCDKCGLFAQRMRNYSKDKTDDHDVYFCPACKNYTEISKIVIPYAFKLFLQELMSICIAPRIRTKKTILE